MKRIAMALATCALAAGLTPLMAQEALALNTGDLVICGKDATTITDLSDIDGALAKADIASVSGEAWLEEPCDENGNVYTLYLNNFKASATNKSTAFIDCNLSDLVVKVYGDCHLVGAKEDKALASHAIRMTYAGDATLAFVGDSETSAPSKLALKGLTDGITSSDSTNLDVTSEIDELSCEATGSNALSHIALNLSASSRLIVLNGAFEAYAANGTAVKAVPDIFAGPIWYSVSKAEALSCGEHVQVFAENDPAALTAKYFRGGVFDISDMKLSFETKTVTYNGTMKLPGVILDDLWPNDITYGVLVKNGTASGVGTHEVALVGRGFYTGITKTATYTTNPLGTKLLSVKAGKKSFTAKWDKQAMQTSGYQLRYSTASSMKGAKTVTISKNTTVSKTVKSLKAKKYYYVQVRTYKNVGGKQLVSKWSPTKKVKTK